MLYFDTSAVLPYYRPEQASSFPYLWRTALEFVYQLPVTHYVRLDVRT